MISSFRWVLCYRGPRKSGSGRPKRQCLKNPIQSKKWHVLGRRAPANCTLSCLCVTGAASKRALCPVGPRLLGGDLSRGPPTSPGPPPQGRWSPGCLQLAGCSAAVGRWLRTGHWLPGGSAPPARRNDQKQTMWSRCVWRDHPGSDSRAGLLGSPSAQSAPRPQSDREATPRHGRPSGQGLPSPEHKQYTAFYFLFTL